MGRGSPAVSHGVGAPAARQIRCVSLIKSLMLPHFLPPSAPRRAIRGPSRRVAGGCGSWLILLRNGAWPSPKLHHPHPRVIVPRAAGALAVDRIPPGTPEGHEVRVGAAVEGGDGAPPEERVIVRPCNGALGQDAR